MSSEKYQDAYKGMNEKQKLIMYDLFMKGYNHDGHSWNTYGDIEDAVADLLEAGKPNVGMLTPTESADASILNIHDWEFEINGKYPVDEQNGKALVAEYTRLKAENEELKKRIEANKFLSGSF